MRQLHLVAYDTNDERRRRRMRQRVRAYAVGAQKSVFECWLDGEERAALMSELAALAGEEGRVLVVRLDPRATMHAVGTGKPPGDGSFFLAA